MCILLRFAKSIKVPKPFLEITYLDNVEVLACNDTLFLGSTKIHNQKFGAMLNQTFASLSNHVWAHFLVGFDSIAFGIATKKISKQILVYTTR